MFDEKQRIAIVEAISCVDAAILCNDALNALEEVKPDIFVKGQDYIGKIEQRHADYCKSHGIEIRFTEEPIFSATQIIHDRLRYG